MDIFELLGKYGAQISEESKAAFNKEFRKTFKHESELAALKEDNDTLRTQLADRDCDIEALKTAAGDSESMKTQISELQAKYETATKEYQEQLSARDYKDAVKEAISSKGIKFTSKAAEKAYIAELTGANLKMENGALIGFDDFHKSQVETDPAAFAQGPESAPPPRFAGPTTPQNTETLSAGALHARGYAAKIKGVINKNEHDAGN